MTVTTLDQIFRSDFSTFLQHLQLSGNLAQSANDFHVPPRKTKYNVWNSSFIAELLHMLLGTAQIVPWETREQMMHDLELETTMDKV